MKKIAYCLLFILAISSCTWRMQIRKYKIDYSPLDKAKDSLLISSFMKIDSIVLSSRHAKAFYCDLMTLRLLEEKTGILSTGDGNIIGKKFTRKDWIEWHKWYLAKF